ncbi:alpha/beta hydrolase [Methanobrevibacter sp.]
MNKKIILGIILILLIAVIASIFYINDYSHAQKTAVDCLNGSGNVSVIDTSNGLLFDGPGNNTALIFYPGAKIEYTSYAPLMMNISKQNIDCYLVEMPFNLAFLGADSADEIIGSSNYTHYFISGHSLGGVAASSYVNGTNNTDGVILLASYPTDEISKPVLSIYGTEDKVLNIEAYKKAAGLFKGNFTEDVIDGANHAQFGDYGNQSGDGRARISAESQQQQTADDIISFINQVIGH